MLALLLVSAISVELRAGWPMSRSRVNYFQQDVE
jgi:hypothetical protein